MRLSVCLIARDEEQFLAGCLESVQSIADEIVLVDTGSSDATLDIARRFGCRLVERPWDDDFSAARNAGIEVARAPWILVLDADERLRHPETVLPALEGAPPEVGGFLLERHDVITHPEDGQRDVYPIEILRLFRNHPALRYEGIVHERPNETVLRAGLEIRSLAPAILTHLVNHLPPERLEAKQRRYLRLLERELARDGRNAWARYYRGKTHWFLRDLDSAEADFRTLADDEETLLSLRASAACMLAALLSERGERGEAVEQVVRSLDWVPVQSLAYNVLAEILYAEGLFERARQAYERVRLSGTAGAAMSQAAGGPRSPVLGDLCMTREKRAYKLGCCALALGDLERAGAHFRAGITANPEHAACRYGLARVEEERGDREAAIAELERAIQLDPPWRTPRERLAALRKQERTMRKR